MAYSEMLRHSPRLISNGYYNPNDLTIRRICYKETAVSIFKKRKPKRRIYRAHRNLISDFQACDFKILETQGPMLTSQHGCLLPPASSPNKYFSIVRKILLFIIFLFLLGFGTWSCYESFGWEMLMSRELGSVKQTIAHQKLEYEKEMGLLKLMITQQSVGKEEIEEIIRTRLSRHLADDTGMADYALESIGASVLASTETHITTYCKLFGITVPCRNKGPERVIQPEVHPGNCWGFKGNQGYLVISLPYPVRITHVTLEHLPRVLSPLGDIRSAPRDFEVYGMVNEKEEGKHLGKFTYNLEGEPIQTFELPYSPSEVYELVRLRILCNWGHPEYTCVYRFRVHSHPRTM